MTLVDTSPVHPEFGLSSENDPPVTVYISRQVRPGCEARFETVMRDMLRAAADAQGHMGASVFRPVDAAHPEYRVVFKFDRTSTLQAWEDSAERHAYLVQMEDLLVAPLHRTHVTGLEAWFTLPGQETPALPNRHRVALVTWLGVYIVGIGFALTLNPVIAPLPVPLRVLIHSCLFVPIMLYAVLPRLTRLFRRFLYPIRRKGRRQGFQD
jgi:antibiotic biosynthesis monooxygenase (ABM) superfamily enzyme